MKFQTGLSFVSVYVKKSYRDGQKTVVCNPLFNYVSSLKQIRQKRIIEKTIITYKLVMLLIKGRNFLIKQSKSILYDTNVCFKRVKDKKKGRVF